MFQRLRLFQTGFPDKFIYRLIKLFNFTFGLRTEGFSIEMADA